MFGGLHSGCGCTYIVNTHFKAVKICNALVACVCIHSMNSVDSALKRMQQCMLLVCEFFMQAKTVLVAICDNCAGT